MTYDTDRIRATRRQRRIATGHRTQPPPPNSQTPRDVATAAPPPQGGTVTPRSLAIYDAIGRRLAAQPETAR